MNKYPSFEGKSELDKYKYLCRFFYLTLGFYATEYNYSEKSRVTHPINGKSDIGVMWDKGRQANEALKVPDEIGINRDDFLND